MHYQQAFGLQHQSYGGEILDRVVGKLGKQAHIDGMRADRPHDQCVAVGRRLRHRFRRDRAAGAGAVLHEHRLAPAFDDPLADDAGIDVRDAADRESADDPDRLGGI